MDSIKINLQAVIIVVLSVVSFYFWNSGNQDRKIANQNMITANDSIKSSIDKYNRVVAEKRSFVIENTKLLKKNDSLKVAIKNIKPVVVVKWKTKIEYVDTLRIPYPVDVEIPCEFDVPWSSKTKWLEISGMSSDKGISINQFTMPNDQTLVIGYKRDGLFGEKYATARIINTNPNIKTLSTESYIIKPKKGIFSKWYTWGAIGVFGGFLISK